PAAEPWRAAILRQHLADPLSELAGSGLVLDLRSSVYAGFWKPTSPHTVTVRVLHESNGQRKVVSHFNKATKGQLTRALLESGANPRTPLALAATLRDLGWLVETSAQLTGVQLDVVVEEI
ncbi:MAG TPA: peroxide stress protein YaaA, partial [Marmoricola sp.]|nr:peroxide stress protein YaaA [Marmoricola sp.]